MKIIFVIIIYHYVTNHSETCQLTVVNVWDLTYFLRVVNLDALHYGVS